MRAPRSLVAMLLGPLAAAAVLCCAATSTATASATASARCKHHRAHHRCPVRHPTLVPSVGDYSSMPTEAQPAYVELSVEHEPLRLSGRANLLATCQPSGKQTLLYAGLSRLPLRFSGTSFSATSQVAGQIELIDEATAGTVIVAGRFTSASSATVTVQLTGIALPHVYPSDGSVAEGAQTCAAGPVTYVVSKVRAPAFPPPRA